VVQTAVEYYGDWNQLDAWLRRKQNVGMVLADLKGPAEKLAEVIKKKAKAKMRSNDPQWPPLSPITEAKKGHSQPFIDTLAYLNSIEDHIMETPDSIMIMVGPEEGITDGMYNYQYIGTQLEFGNSTIPARPLWRPLVKQIPQMPEFKECLLSIFADFQ
jgi:hypothetical protein